MSDLTPEMIYRAGMALYGREWQAPLAKLVGVDERTVRRLTSAVRRAQPYAYKGDWKTPILAALKAAPLEFELRAREAAEVYELLKADPE